MFSVLDGHGVDGHHVSAFVKTQLVEEFEASIKKITKRNVSVPTKTGEKASSSNINNITNPNEPNSSKSIKLHSRTRKSTKSLRSKVLHSIEAPDGMQKLEVDTDSSHIVSEANYPRSRSVDKRINSKKLPLIMFS